MGKIKAPTEAILVSAGTAEQKLEVNSAEVFSALEHVDQYTNWTGYQRKKRPDGAVLVAFVVLGDKAYGNSLKNESEDDIGCQKVWKEAHGCSP